MKNQLAKSFVGFLFSSLFIVSLSFGQCPAANSNITSNQTISSNCVVSGNLSVTGATLTIDPGVTLTVTGTLTVRAGSTVNATGAIINAGTLTEAYGSLNTFNGGSYSVGSFGSGGGGDFTMSSVTLNVNPSGSFGITGADVIIQNSTLTGITTVTTSVSSLALTNTDITASGNIGLEDLTLSGGNLSAGGTFTVSSGDNITGATIGATGVTLNGIVMDDTDFTMSGALSVTGSGNNFQNSSFTGATTVTTNNLTLSNTDISASGALSVSGTSSFTGSNITGVTTVTATNLTLSGTDIGANGTFAISGTSSFSSSNITGVTNWTTNVNSLGLTNTNITASGSVQLEDFTANGGSISAGTSFSITNGTNSVTGMTISAASAAIRTTTITDSDVDISGNMDITSGAVTFDNSEVDVNSLDTQGGTDLTVQNGSNFIVALDMFNREDLTVDGAYMEIGRHLDATGGDNITVRNGGELVVKGDYRMNNGGGVQLNLEDGGLVKIEGNVESTTGGNSIDVDDNSGISVGGEFTGGSPPTVSVGTDDEDSDCLSGGGCCGDPGACSSATTLPVSLLDFTHSLNDYDVTFNWSTASELNNDFFTLERSNDGIFFTEVCQVSGAGTTNEVSYYNYTDNLPHYPETMYYRLSQTDYDGTHKELGIITFYHEPKYTEIRLFPNPVVSTTYVKLQGVAANTGWSMFSMAGELVKSGQFGVQRQIDVSDLKPGSYLVRIDATGSSKVLVIK